MTKLTMKNLNSYDCVKLLNMFVFLVDDDDFEFWLAIYIELGWLYILSFVDNCVCVNLSFFLAGGSSSLDSDCAGELFSDFFSLLDS